MTVAWQAGLDMVLFDSSGVILHPHPKVFPLISRSLPTPVTIEALQKQESLFAEIAKAAIENALQHVRRALESGHHGETVQHHVPVALEHPVPMTDREGEHRHFKQAVCTVTYNRTLVPVPVLLNRYVDSGESQTVCEVLEGQVTLRGEPYLIQVLTTPANGLIPAGSKISLRVEPLSARGRELLAGIDMSIDDREDVTAGAETPPGMDLHIRINLIDS